MGVAQEGLIGTKGAAPQTADRRVERYSWYAEPGLDGY